jgi:LCP family protein required for cell wall assembly
VGRGHLDTARPVRAACRPARTARPGQIDPAQSEAQFYDAMGEGGPACAVATVEQMTDIRMDHFLELTFDAFIDLTDAVGGVQICVPEPGIDDPNYSGLVLSAGLHTVVGNQALAFVRDRHGLAGGMDTSRIQMQQQFMTALFNKLTSNGTLEDPITLYKIATRSATTSPWTPASTTSARWPADRRERRHDQQEVHPVHHRALRARHG